MLPVVSSVCDVGDIHQGAVKGHRCVCVCVGLFSLLLRAEEGGGEEGREKNQN